MSSSLSAPASSRQRPQQRRKQTDDTQNTTTSLSTMKRTAQDRADGEPRQKRKKLEPIFAASATSRRNEGSAEAKLENDKAASLNFTTIPAETLYGYLSQHDLIPMIFPSPLSAHDPPAPSFLEDPVRQSSLPLHTPANRPRREHKEGRRRSLRLQEDEFATRTPILADLKEVHTVIASIVEAHVRELSSPVREVDTLAGFMCSLEKKKGMDRNGISKLYAY